MRGIRQIFHRTCRRILISFPLKPAIQVKPGKTLALLTEYPMPSCHGWRKLVLDKSHPKADSKAREAWKKLPERLAESALKPQSNHGEYGEKPEFRAILRTHQ